MKTINKNELSKISGGDVCKEAGWLFGLGAFATANPFTALAGVFILTVAAGTLAMNDCAAI